MDGRDGAVVVAAGEGALDLARQGLAERMAHEVARIGCRVGRDVERLVGADARDGAARNIAHGVAACFASAKPNIA